MIVPIHRGHVNDRGRLVLEDRAAWESYLSRFCGKAVEILVRIPIINRTLPQNRYYWKIIVGCTAEQTGMTTGQVHEWFKRELLPPEMHQTPKGEWVEVLGTTTTLTVQEFSEFTDQAFALAAQEGIIFPADLSRVEVA